MINKVQILYYVFVPVSLHEEYHLLRKKGIRSEQNYNRVKQVTHHISKRGKFNSFIYWDKNIF